jgi:hypothetical protein
MKRHLFIILVLATMGALADDAKKLEEVKSPPPQKPQPIEIAGETPGISIDPVTLAVSWQKGADPKQVVKSMVKLWAQAQNQLGQCTQQIQRLSLEAEKAKDKK